MAYINFKSVDVDFPVFNSTSRSLTSKFLAASTGGLLDSDARGNVVVRALNQLNLEIHEGDRVALLGHNGSGKSTLLRALGGIYQPTRGEAIVEGKVGSLIDISLGINPEATGRENIFIRGALLGLTKREMISNLDDIIEFSELGKYIDMPVRTYSSGMHLRLAFSVSTVVRPEILLMDEWLSVGDESFRSKAEIRLKEIVSSTKILVIASHTRSLIENTCNRAVWLEHGTIKSQGTAVDVCTEYFG